MKKICLLFLSIVFLVGCSLQEENSPNAVNTIFYQLHISDYYQENITFTLPKNAYELAEQNQEEDYDSIEYVLLKDNYSRPIYNNVKSFYQKEIQEYSDAVEVQLKFHYLENDFENENYMHTCFEKTEILNNDDSFEIHLSGKFYCLQDKSLTIQVSSDYENDFTNGTIVGNTSQWTITENNQDHVDLYYKVYRDKNKMITNVSQIPSIEKQQFFSWELLVLVCVIIGGLFYYYMISKKRKRKRKRRK